jgi:hypothetical protein
MLGKRFVALMALGVVALAGCSAPAGGGGSNPTSTGSAANGAAPAGEAVNLPQVGATVDATEFTKRTAAAMKTQYHAVTTTTMSGTTAVTTADIDATDADNLKMHTVGAGSELIFCDGKSYIKTGSKWTKSSADLSKTMEKMTNSIGSGLSQSVTYVGASQLDGVPAYEYKVTAESSSTSGSAGAISMEAHYWIDAQYRLLKTSSKAKVGGTSVSSEVVYSKFGEPVSITAPM